MKKVLTIVGPTAVGKTSISIKLAKKFNGEIINGDSVQIYQRLNIGSAKITKEEMQGIPHHLLDIKAPDEPFSVAEFQKIVRDKITEISARNKLPIIVGGTGLYIQAVLADFYFSEEKNITTTTQFENLSNEALHLLLMQIDENEAKKIHQNNRRRIIRALEIYQNHSKPKSELLLKHQPKLLYDSFIVGLNMERKLLYERINKRVDMMLDNNLLEEVTELYTQGFRVNAIGYKEFNEYFSGNMTLAEVVELIKKHTRNYAKRQLTYFRNKLDIYWYDVNRVKLDAIVADIDYWIKKGM